MYPITESKNEGGCVVDLQRNKTNVLSQTNEFCILQALINQITEVQLSNNNYCEKKNSGRIKTIASDIIFELKTTLANISLAAELLETGLLSHEQKMFVDVILRNSKRLSDLITNLNINCNNV